MTSPPTHRGSWRARTIAAIVSLGVAWLGAFVVSAPAHSANALARGMPWLTEMPAGARVRGEGTLRWLGLKVYEARLYTGPAGIDAQKIGATPFALELVYARALDGKNIARTSLREMQRLDPATSGMSRPWLEAMEKMFPDVAAGDRLAALYLPGKGTRFFHNDQVMGVIEDNAFARAFFGIWLDARTAAPELRQALLGDASRPDGSGGRAGSLQ